MRDLQTALGLARSNPTISAVWVARGRYLAAPAFGDPTQSFDVPGGVTLYGGFAGHETSPDQRDIAANATILSGDLAGNDGPGFTNRFDNSHRVLVGSGASLALDGLTISGGRFVGAGIYSRANHARLVGVTLEDNGDPLNQSGGGLYFDGGRLELASCLVRRNKATGGAGVFAIAGRLEIDSSTFVENEGGANGGGLQFLFPLGGVRSASLRSCTFRQNEATTGAGISVTGGGSLLVEDVLFDSNVGNFGAGLFVSASDGVNLDATRCTFLGNRSCAGGGVFLNWGEARFTNCRFERNGFGARCGLGAGGGAIKAQDGSLLLMEHCVFAGNSDEAVWGDDSSDVDLQFSSFHGKEAVRVGGGRLSMSHSVLWGTNPEQVRTGSGAQILAQYCNVRNGGFVLAGLGNLEVEPLFVAASAGDLRLSPGSPCIDAGDPLLVPVGTDFERDSRLLDGDRDRILRVDIGADEFGPLHLAVDGALIAGGTVTVVVSGTPGLACFLRLGAPGLQFVPGLGTVFLQLSGSSSFPWPISPSNVPVVVPSGLSGLFHLQAVGLGGGALALTNFVPLSF